MSQVRTRRVRPTLARTTARLVALVFTGVMVLGFSLVGVAYAEDYRDRDDRGQVRDRDIDRDDRGQVRDRDIDRDDRGQFRDRDIDRDNDGDIDDRDAGHDARGGTGDLERLEPAVPAGGLVAGTPCSTRAVACVSLKQKKSWLFTKDGNGGTVVDHGPVAVSTGGPGKETPLGDYVVEWKNKNHKSGEYFVPHGCKPPAAGCTGAPMNWAVFFAEGGIAFHEGALALRSSGCVRLSAKEAEFYYNTLELGDRVEIRN